MAGDWRECALGDVVELKRGYDLPEQSRIPGHVPIISSSGPSGVHREAKVRGPGVVTGRYGTIGQVFFVANDFWPLNTTLYVRDFKGNDPRFISYFLRSLDFLAFSDKAAVPGINRNHLHQACVRLPVDIREQRTIALILGVLDDKISLNGRTNETLESMARALFKSWMVDFDPVRAKAEGRNPGLPSPIADLFPDRLIDSELGQIPEGWRAGTVGAFSIPLSGGTPSKSDPALWNGEIPWISPKVMAAVHADEPDSFVTDRALGNGTRIAPVGSTLVMVRGMGLHDKVRVSQARREVTFNQDVKALVPRDIDSDVLFFALLDAQPELLRRVESSGHGTGRLPTEILMAHVLVRPSDPLHDYLARLLGGLNRRIALARAESRALATLRDALLPKLISGEVRVRTAENMVQQAV